MTGNLQIQVTRDWLQETGVKTFTSADDSLLLIKSLAEDSATPWQYSTCLNQFLTLV